jgi:hypothetical protein
VPRVNVTLPQHHLNAGTLAQCRLRWCTKDQRWEGYLQDGDWRLAYLRQAVPPDNLEVREKTATSKTPKSFRVR